MGAPARATDLTARHVTYMRCWDRTGRVKPRLYTLRGSLLDVSATEITAATEDVRPHFCAAISVAAVAKNMPRGVYNLSRQATP